MTLRLIVDNTPHAQRQRWERLVQRVPCPTCRARAGEHCRMRPLPANPRKYHLTRHTHALRRTT